MSSSWTELRDARCQVITIGVGDEPDFAQLNTLKRRIGGDLRQVDALAMVHALTGIVTEIINSAATIEENYAPMGQGETVSLTIPVDELSNEVSFTVSWGDHLADPIGIQLIRPGGTVFNEADAVSNPDIDLRIGRVYKVLTVRRPSLTTGDWQVNLTTNAISGNRVDVYLHAGSDATEIKLAVDQEFPAYTPNERVILSAEPLFAGYPVINGQPEVTVEAYVSGPGLSVPQLVRMEDQSNPLDLSGNGTYVGVFHAS